MTIISARSLCKSFGAEPLLDGVSLTIEEHERVGLLGRNGAGKSTLLRILAGLDSADSGIIERRRDSRVLHLPQEPRLDPERTPRELVEDGLSDWKTARTRYASLSEAIERGGGSAELLHEQAELAETIERLGGWEKAHVVEQMLIRLGVRDADRPIGTMSGGEQRRVALARLLVAEPDLAILDEPTNHLDADTIDWLEAYLVETFRGSVLLVTHDRYVLDAVCDRICELDRGVAREYRGNYADYLEQKAELEAHAERVESNRLNVLRRERAWLLRGAKARTTKQKARIERAKALMAGAPAEARERIALTDLGQGASRTGKTILDLIDVGLKVGDKQLIENLTLRMVSGDRIGIIGRNGVGKTSLLKLVTGELAAASGQVVLGQQTRAILFDQTRAQLREDWSVFDNVADREGAERNGSAVVRIGALTYELRTYLERFSFKPNRQRQKVSSLSGGERARVALAKALCTGANLLLLDEPTNDLDIETLSSLEELLETWPGCALVVSHDRYFLDRVATSILAFEGGGKVVQYPGGYASYRSLKEQAEAQRQKVAEEKGAAPRPQPPVPRADSRAKPLSYAERRELDGLLDRVSEAEERLRTLEAELSKPAAYADPEAAKRLTEAYERARVEVDELTSRWVLLEERKASAS